MAGSSILSGLRKAMAILLATLIFVAVLEGHSARAYFATPSDHTHQLDDDVEGPSEQETSKGQASHVHYEDHSHSFGYTPQASSAAQAESVADRWGLRDDPNGTSRSYGLTRPPRTVTLR